MNANKFLNFLAIIFIWHRKSIIHRAGNPIQNSQAAKEASEDRTKATKRQTTATANRKERQQERIRVVILGGRTQSREAIQARSLHLLQRLMR